VIFRNVHKLLVDTASSEFLFCLDFWEDESVFKELFGPVVAVVESDLATQLQVTGRGSVVFVVQPELSIATLLHVLEPMLRHADTVLCAAPVVCCVLQEQHDLLCVLLMIRLNAEHRALMVARRVPCLDDYLDRVNLLLWPRFKVRMCAAPCCLLTACKRVSAPVGHQRHVAGGDHSP
jgi:hypothetical protein